MSTSNDTYPICLTARTSRDLSPDETSELDEDPNTTVSCEPQEQHGSSTSEDAGPALEATPDSSPRSHAEPSSVVVSETSSMEEQSPSGSWDGSDTYSESDDESWPPLRRISLPEVTISAFTETGQAESSIVVPKQRAYTGTKPVISSHLADTPCVTLGVRGLLDRLNSTLGTSYAMDTPSLSSLLEDYIAKDWDFGMVYGHLRRAWYTRNCQSTIRDTLREWEEKDGKMRRKALAGNQIIEPHLRPRRVWDLYSNRVVPWWCTGLNKESTRNRLIEPRRPRPISHAWMDEKDLVNVWTPINGYEWPVPIPKDASLKLIRIEVLNINFLEVDHDLEADMDTEYTWLDVLCLRQKDGLREDMRAEEWKLDVPTIGAVYHQAEVVCYLSGLGRPLTLKEGDLESDRCWFRRAWTVQEIGWWRVIAGDTPHGSMHAEPINEDGKYETELLTRFHKQLKSTEDVFVYNGIVLAALEEMQKRVSTNPVDKVAGLAFCLQSSSIPAYYESESLEDAWAALVNSMSSSHRGELFSRYPEVGNGGRKWRPSWDQVMTKPMPTEEDPTNWSVFIVYRIEEMDVDYCSDWKSIEEVLVRGLAVVEGSDRCGKLIVYDRRHDGRVFEHAFNITATHKYPIPDNTYTLMCPFRTVVPAPYCVVGRRLTRESFEKVSVLKFPDEEEWTRLHNLSSEGRWDILV
ncbi:hypothetical protein ARMSODRAFT_1018618 [Armillaria solidipes]|uniref:Heterokaryon incompatibility domain-containing protein n=1 Tax=Armillaria solidipes TaxID=1076256 RepID=A0A2H3BV01_9AGAR|nr:hypothetical protein ARMSODRAFT_1018618 [Armillaria solidipes]